MVAIIIIQINTIFNKLSNSFLITLCKLQFRILPKKIKIKDLYNLKNNGFVKLENFIDREEILEYKNNIYKIISSQDWTNAVKNEKQSGNVKLKAIQNYSYFFKNFSKKYFYFFISVFFYGYIKKPNIIFTYTTDGKKKNKYVTGKCTKQIAGEPHIDSYRNYLKILIFLSDVEHLNGPTNLLVGPGNEKSINEIYINNYINKSNTRVDKIMLRKLMKNHKIVELTGKKGDAYLVNTKNIHWAGNMISGQREILWLYF